MRADTVAQGKRRVTLHHVLSHASPAHYMCSSTYHARQASGIARVAATKQRMIREMAQPKRRSIHPHVVSRDMNTVYAHACKCHHATTSFS